MCNGRSALCSTAVRGKCRIAADIYMQLELISVPLPYPFPQPRRLCRVIYEFTTNNHGEKSLNLRALMRDGAALR